MGVIVKELTNEVLRDLYRQMVRIRLFEENAGKLQENGSLPGILHMYVGQEAIAAGVITHLSDQDQITSTHRGHGHLVAKGGEMGKMYAELFGKATGYNKGKGGSMHICNMEVGMLGANGIVGAGPPIAVGAAFSNKFRKTDNVSIAFFGDGASNEGAFHEAANLAAVLKLPVVFICENNGFGEFTPQAQHQAITDVADRAAGYGMPGVVADGMDVVAVFEAAGEAIDRARSGEGPTLLEFKTYRFYDHSGVRGMGFAYRTEDEVEKWKKRDPLDVFKQHLLDQKLITEEEATELSDTIQREVDAGIEFAENSPEPDLSALLEDVYTSLEG